MNDLEKLAKQYFAEEGDNHLFPNHSDEDIYIKGFTALCRKDNNDSKELLLKAIANSHIDEPKAKLILDLLNIENSKHGIMKFCFTEEEIRKIDTAYPQDYADRVRELLPNWNGIFNVYDYNKARVFGEFKNIAEAMVTKILRTFTS